jgi:hypothetical protein
VSPLPRARACSKGALEVPFAFWGALEAPFAFWGALEAPFAFWGALEAPLASLGPGRSAQPAVPRRSDRKWRTRPTTRSMAISFSPPSGMITSAKRFEGSTYARCIGRTCS